ncbi:DUF488 family protein [Salinirubrum litoreum]|uniref:DUF488 family protein n=1 Tax=Salinirubrum litoreum TaxID=1126234 RepID=A0ABD5RGA4_9EURY|nr:DUF488 family protein [Salinirubrum litoreum]
MPPGPRLHDTYVAALQHDLAALPEGTTLVGVVRRPTGWFHAAVDENYPEVAPPDALLDDFEEQQEAFAMRGLCAEEAHNAAWDAVDFGERYRRHLQTDSSARDGVADLRDRLRAGESLALVCFENTDAKRCHRTMLREHLLDTLADGE